MSFTKGMFSSVISPCVRSEAAIAGNAEFLAPLIRTVPSRGLPPVILSLSILQRRGLALCFLCLLWANFFPSFRIPVDRRRRSEQRDLGHPRLRYRHHCRAPGNLFCPV